MIFPILLCLIGNEFLAFISGTYFCILLSITVSGDCFELVCELLLVITGAILAKMLKEDKLQICIYLIIISMSIVTPGIFYYMSNKGVFCFRYYCRSCKRHDCFAYRHHLCQGI